MEHKRKRVPISSNHSLASGLEGADICIVDDSKESSTTVEFVRKIWPNINVVPAGAGSSEFSVPALIRRDGQVFRGFSNIERQFGKNSDTE